MAHSSTRHAGPAIALGVLVLIIGGGTGVLSSNEVRAGAHYAPTYQTDVLLLDWRDPRPEDALMVARSIPDSAVIPVVEGTAYAESCNDFALLLNSSEATCSTASMSATLESLTGLSAVVGAPPIDSIVSDVLIGGDSSLTEPEVWRAVNSRLPAVNLPKVIGQERIQPPLAMSWIFGGLVVGAALLTLAVAHSFGNRLLALEQENQVLKRLGLDIDQISTVQRGRSQHHSYRL